MADETIGQIDADISVTETHLQTLEQEQWVANTRTSALLEDGSRVDTKPYQVRERRVWSAGADHTCYEHVADAPDGEWIYRYTDA